LKRKVGPLVSQIGSGLLRLGGDNRRSAKIGDALIAPDGLLPAYLVRRRLFTSWQIQRMYPAVGLSGWYRGIPCEQFEFLESLISDRNAPDALGLMEMEQYMGQQLLRDTDVMGMANSLEIRVPFLDADFALLALRLPSSARIPGMVQKHRFVEAIREWLPPENISRPKQGFSMPFESWMMSELHEDVCAGVHGLIRTLPGGNESSIQRIVSDFYRNPDRVGWSRPWALFVLGHYLNKTGLIVATE
jgi:asparagine synthase (glutamine-hydrolysing)